VAGGSGFVSTGTAGPGALTAALPPSTAHALNAGEIRCRRNSPAGFAGVTAAGTTSQLSSVDDGGARFAGVADQPGRGQAEVPDQGLGRGVGVAGQRRLLQ